MFEKFFTLQIVRYGFIGAISTLIHMCIAFLYIHYMNDSLFVSNTLGFLTAYTFSYLVQSRYVFRHTVSLRKASKYFIVQFVSLLIALSISYQLSFINSYIQTIIVVLIIPLVTFLVHKVWTFK